MQENCQKVAFSPPRRPSKKVAVKNSCWKVVKHDKEILSNARVGKLKHHPDRALICQDWNLCQPWTKWPLWPSRDNKSGGEKQKSQQFTTKKDESYVNVTRSTLFHFLWMFQDPRGTRSWSEIPSFSLGSFRLICSTNCKGEEMMKKQTNKRRTKESLFGKPGSIVHFRFRSRASHKHLSVKMKNK